MAIVTRFAPSPNGFLHLGHGYSAWLNHKFAAENGGRYLVRIEDIDDGRARPAFDAAILEDLGWLGLSPIDKPARQSEHVARYAEALRQLRDRGLLYRSFLSRREIATYNTAQKLGGRTWPHDPDGAPHCPPVDRDRSWPESDALAAAGQAFSWRLNMSKAVGQLANSALTWTDIQSGPQDARPAAWGDVILAGKNKSASYHLAVVVDDAAQGISHVIRGDDLREATSIHRLLQVLLELPPPVYQHHPVILDKDGQKLSKSNHSTSLRELRVNGITVELILAGYVRGAMHPDDYLGGGTAND